MKFKYIILVLLIMCLGSCQKEKEGIDKKFNNISKKIGVLLVNHGSHSETWRNMLLDIEKQTRDSILKDRRVSDVKTGFMEYNEPSIATRLNEFDLQGFTDIIIIPIFLTVSDHSFEDIPTIAGLKDDKMNIEKLKNENILTYKAKANIHITQLLDYPKILSNNIIRRIKALSGNPEEEGLVLIAYGDVNYNEEWENLMNRIGKSVQDSLKISEYSYAWCGHIVHYDPLFITKAINLIFSKKKKALVVPALVAIDETFQTKIIGNGINNSKYPKNVIYKSDSILPDPEVCNWVIDICNQYVNDILNSTNYKAKNK